MLLTFLACTAPATDTGRPHYEDDTADTGSDSADTGADPADLFFLGVNYPWHEYAIDVRTTAWGDYTIAATPDDVRSQLRDLSSHGARGIRWWLFGDGRGAPTFASDGTPQPVDAEVLENVGLFLDLADQEGLTVMPVVLDFAWCSAPQEVYGVTLGGHAGTLADPDQRAALVNDVVAPLAAEFAAHPALAAWDLFNEPEWAMNGEYYGLGDHCSAEDVRAYADEATAAIAAVAPQPTTVGSASYAWMLQHWVAADPPVLQFHDYWEPLDMLSADLGRPVLVGEFPTAGTDLPATLDTAVSGGFAGAMPWSGFAEDDATALDREELAAWAAAHADILTGSVR